MSFNLATGITFKHWAKLIKTISITTYKVLVAIYAFSKKLIHPSSLFEAKESVVFNEAPKETEDTLRKEPVFGKEIENNKKEIEKAPKKATTEPVKVIKNKSKQDNGYKYPDINLLSRPKDKIGLSVNEKELNETASALEEALSQYGVNGKIVKVRPGPVVTLYELDPASGTRTSRIISLADDIARSMAVSSVRIATVSGSTTVGIEVPNSKRETVWVRDLLEDVNFTDSKNTLNIVLGKDIGGKNVYADLAKMPHLLIAGTTGSGKSVGVNAMILSLLYRMTPDECKFMLIDPKMLEFSMYNGIPHLLTPVITDPAKAVIGLKWAVREMEERYRAMACLSVRNITGYNLKLKEMAEKGETPKRTIQVGFDENGKPKYEEQLLDTKPLPYIVIVVDEAADLMMVAGKEVEAAIQRLAQMARAAGIHLIMSTQRPSADVITGTIKSNFPSRISYQVTSKINSRTILDEQGAEQLLGRGDMLYMPAGLRPQRIHGGFVPDEEVEAVMNFLKSQGEPKYVDGVTEGELDTKGKDSGPLFDKTSMGGGSSKEDLYEQAVSIVRNDKKASISYIQRRLGVGYNKAATLIERMEEEGVVGPADHVGRREVI
ncbi:MAG: cell division protein FtsK [Alphaproteobacteria bacterium]|nr:cell division protein FtsK [Alphaproteobacteria bacterium]